MIKYVISLRISFNATAEKFFEKSSVRIQNFKKTYAIMKKHLLDDADNTEVEGTANESRTKKRKIRVAEEPGSSNGITSDTLSKEERKELKHLKRSKVEDAVQERKESVAPAAIEAEREERNKDKSAAKLARKKMKAKLKAAKILVRERSESKDGQPSNVSKVEGEQDNKKIAAKAARKAEKARLKAAKKLAADTLEEDGGSLSVEMELKENEKGESALRKAPRKAENGRITGTNNLKKNDAIGLKTHATPAFARKTAIQAQTTANKTSVQSGYEEDPTLTALPQSDIDSFLSANFIQITDPISPNILRPILNFSQLPKSSTKLSPFTNFKSPTPIQAAAWPFLLSGRDVVGVAETGSGKTLAFGVPCVRSIATISRSRISNPCTKAVIVSPTRELAVQIHDQILKLASAAGLRSVCIYGGVPKDPQRQALPTAHIIVATPGRLNDLISEGAADLSGVTYLVLDEADRMLDTGFEPEIRKIINCTPSTGIRQTLMFTATWPPSVRTLASSFMRDPVHIGIGRDNPDGALRANTSITQRVEVVDPYDKEQRLLQLIKEHQSGSSANDRILVFCLYKKEATRVEGFLRSRGLRVAGIHGDLSQERRTASLDSFKNGECPLLVATDVASRGLDIPAVKLVLNVTFPLTVEDYVHRIGR